MASMFEEENYFIPPLSKYSSAFPNPRLSSDEGLLAYGGDLSSHRLLTAYKKEYFHGIVRVTPYSGGHPIHDCCYTPKSLK